MNVNIRTIKEADYPQTIEVIKRSNRQSLGSIYPKELIDIFCSKYDLELFKEKAKEIEYFVAEDIDSGRILGVIGLKRNELRTFFVDPDYQGKGVGSKLYKKLEETAKARGIRVLILEGSPLGEPVYTHFGFSKEKIISKEKAGIKYTDAYMVKKLE